MSIPIFRIGNEPFLGMDPPPKRAHKQMTYLTRTGANYASVFQDGIRGDLQEIVTEAEANGDGDVETLISNYQQLAAGIPKLFKWRNISYGTYLIHDVNCTASSVLYVSSRVRSVLGLPANDFIVVARWVIYPTTDVH